MNKYYEVDLYHPVETYFTKLGYDVKAEVNDCDVVATKGDQLVIVELKKTVNMTLLIQATKRQRMTDQVYIVVPKPTYSLRSRKWQDICHLVRRLELGLLVVSIERKPGFVEKIHEPKAFSRKKSMSQSKNRKDKLIREVTGRSDNYNIGGSQKVKIHTAYKEDVIHIATCLDYFGTMSPKKLRELGTGDKTGSILQKNYYGWFKRVRRGIYQLSDLGSSEYQEHPLISGKYKKILKEKHPLQEE